MENGGQTPQILDPQQGDPKKPANGGNGQDSEFQFAGPSRQGAQLTSASLQAAYDEAILELEADSQERKLKLQEEAQKRLESVSPTQADIDYGLTDEQRRNKLVPSIRREMYGAKPSGPTLDTDPRLLDASIRNAGMFDFAVGTLGHKDIEGLYQYDPNQPFYVFDENYNIVDIRPSVSGVDPDFVDSSGMRPFGTRQERIEGQTGMARGTIEGGTLGDSTEKDGVIIYDENLRRQSVIKPDQPGFKGISFNEEYGGDPNYQAILNQLDYPFRVEQDEPDWLADIPKTEEEVQEYADRRIKELVPGNLLSDLGPAVRTRGIGVTEEDIKSDVERYNKWVDQRNEAFASAFATVDSELAEMGEKTESYQSFLQNNYEQNAKVFNKLFRDSTPESIKMINDGTGTLSDLRLLSERDITYHLPTGKSSRARLSILDFFNMNKPDDEWVWGYSGDGLPSRDEMYTMIDLWIEEHPQLFQQYNDEARKKAAMLIIAEEAPARTKAQKGGSIKDGTRLLEDDMAQLMRVNYLKYPDSDFAKEINAKAQARVDKTRYELAFRFMVSKWVKDDILKVSGDDIDRQNANRNLTTMETTVFEDLSSDPYMYGLMKKVGFSSGAYRINIDHDPIYIGRQKSEAVKIGDLEVFSAQTVDQWNALTGPGATQAGISLYGAWTTTAQATVSYSPIAAGAAAGAYVAGPWGAVGGGLVGAGVAFSDWWQEDVAAPIVRSLERDYDSYKARKTIEMQEEIAALDTYAYTRDQVKILGYMSGYTLEEINDMSVDAQLRMIERNTDEMTAFFGAFDAQEYRQALISMPTSAIATTMGAVTTLATGGNVVAGAGVAAYFMGAAVYQEEFYNNRNNPDLANLNRDEHRAMALVKAGNEVVAEFMGNALTLGAGKFITGMGVKGGAKLTSAYVLGDTYGTKALRVMGGMMLGTGLALPEEYVAESLTEYLNIIADDYFTQLNDGKVSSFSEYKQKTNFLGLYNENVAQIQEAGRMGMAGAIIPGGGGVAMGYGKAAYDYMFNRESFYSQAMVQLVSSETVTKEMSIFERREYNKKLKEFQKLSPSEMMSERGQALATELADIVSETHELGAVAAADLRGLAKVNPALFADSYTADMQARQLEAEGGNYTQDESGRWRLNGKFVADPTKTRSYKKNQRMSDEAKAAVMERAKAIRAGVRQNHRERRLSNVF